MWEEIGEWFHRAIKKLTICYEEFKDKMGKE
jgi:hypothetical protein